MHSNSCKEGNEEEDKQKTMNYPNYGKIENNAPSTMDPPELSEKQRDEESDPLKLRDRSAVPTDCETPSPSAQQYQPYCESASDRFTQYLVVQPQQGDFPTPLQPTNEPDHLSFSIFTMLCCCLPIGIAAFVYSIKTREANRAGNGTAAKEFSKRAHSLARRAFLVGVATLIANFIIVGISELKHLAATMKNIHQEAMKP